ncbi:MAG: translation initiation factor IF-2 [Candidatus Omnitrophota bacterium]|nr:MAG: translation initiation factor IF-2 [Candidatus Omnitrophota bacterium]RKY35660.1 MAG: translation initiation factor IF-2 [Candidatus Omnitrophota bacterium]RKY43720.1 MAG: translation initiation factor IF-2 [Candidatus Omnitrophota bacterium]
MRVYELAKELGLDSKEFLKKLKEMNFPVKSHLSIIDEETAQIIKEEFKGLKEKEISKNIVEVEFPLTVKDFSVKLGKKPSEIVQLLLRKGKFLNINQNIDQELAKDLAYQLGFTLKEKTSLEEELIEREILDESRAKPRPPVVTLMGHIDHGKTSLLDFIRKSRLTEKETGGITQHIGAYQVETPKGKITFIDTPGHETFTSMRARGANLTDIVVLVVAADEGVKPQTEEAISHAKAAGVPIVVAINKIDKPQAQPDMVKQQLSKLGLSPEDWGGQTTTVLVSAKTGEGIDELLEMLLLEAELLELKADYQRPALGVVLEAKLSKGLGPIATVIVQQGTFRVGDVVVCADQWGRVRLLRDDRGNSLKEAYPSMPVELVGLGGLVSAGERFIVVPEEKEAIRIVEKRRGKKEKKVIPEHVRLENIYEKIKKQELKEFRVIIKADTYGTLEAIEDILKKIEVPSIEIKILHKGVGVVNLSDVILADASDALILGFKVNVEPQASKKAQEKNIQIKTYQIIYELISEVKSALEGLLEPKIERVFLGRAKVKKVFKLSKAGVIAGCIVEKGRILRNAFCRVLRTGEVVFEGRVSSLKRFKDDVREVLEGFECGIGVGFNDIKEEDVIEVFTEETKTRKIQI